MNYLIKTLLFIFYLLFLTFQISVAQSHSRLDRLTLDDGLSQNNIREIIQDSQGFMWFGCDNGLNRYDGYSFTIYQHDPADSASLSDNLITALYEDGEGIIWVGTSAGGLNFYDPDLDTFSRLQLISDSGIEVSYVQDITGDGNGSIYIATTGGLFVYNKKSGKLSFYNPIDDYQLSSSDIVTLKFVNKNNLFFQTQSDFCFYNLEIGEVSVHEGLNKLNAEFNFKTVAAESMNCFWAGTSGNGLFRIEFDDAGELIIENFKSEKKNKYYIGSNNINQIYIDQKEELWVVTDEGIDLYNRTANDFTPVHKQTAITSGMHLNNVNDMFVDNVGILWIGTQGEGIYIYNDKKIKFEHYNFEPENPNSIPGNIANAFYEDASGNLWIGTWNNGLSYFNRSKNTYTNYRNNPTDDKSLSSDRVRCILADAKKNLWIATQNGINRFDPTTKTFIRYKETSNTFSLFLDSKNNFWICEGSKGLALYDYEQDSFSFIAGDQSNIITNFITNMTEDKNDNLWLGQYGSLVNYDEKKDTSIVYIPDNQYPDSSISHQNVTCLLYDSNNRLWIGTEGGGLNLYHPENNTFTHYRVSDGLPSDLICAILEDDDNNLWVSTLNGVTKFDPGNEKFVNYTVDEGLQSKEFKLRSALKLRSGEMVFGGVNGFNIFHPDSIKNNLAIPPVVITNFMLNYKPVQVGKSNHKNFVLEKQISHTKELLLKYDQNIITFGFTALNYTLSKKNKYAYTLEGFDKEWHDIGYKREVTFTGLAPGEYVFRVKASNNDGVWNEDGASINITISPPYWGTPLAFFIYSVLLIIFLLLLRKFIQKEENLRANLKYEKLEAQKAQELFNMKMQFFTNISHEIRTPLTLIIGPAEKIINSQFADKDLNNQIHTIKRNAKSLLRLVNQLLDFRKLETGHLKIETEWGDIMDFLLRIKELFNSQAEAKQIDFSSNFYPQQLWCYFDPDKMEKILYNLLSNSFKFNKKGGKVDLVAKLIYVNQESEYGGLPSELPFIKIQVKDSGMGIRTENQPNIFTRFYQGALSEGKNFSGSGIGLSFTKQIVQHMGGDISFESKVGVGSTFVVKIPLLLEKESNENDFQKTVKHINPVTLPEDIIFDEAIDDSTNDKDAFVLIIEDNIDVCNYIVGEIKEEYHTMVAHDGEEGWLKTINKMPELVICDIMMPVMDGLTYCTKLKNDRLTSHIPIILLTARVSEDNKLQGLEVGADDYITKPFSATLLKARVKNLLENRRKIKQRFGFEIDVLPSEITLTILDEEFLSSAIEIVTEHQSEVDFSIEQLCAELGVSRTNLHVKLKAITGMSASIFIRVIRLKQAARLLKSGRMNISEVAFSVGFNDPKYFSKCFKEHFNVLPTNYAKSL